MPLHGLKLSLSVLPNVAKMVENQYNLCRYVTHYPGPDPKKDEVVERLKNLGEGQITLKKDENKGIAFICLDHLDKKNALSGKMMVELAKAVDDLENWSDGKGVILHSVGDFCSGGDLTVVKQIANNEDGFAMACLMHDSLLRLHRLPLVSVALVNGRALGGGAELTVACDFRLFSPTGELRFVQAKMGVTTGWGGGTRLVHLVGYNKALDILTSCQKIPLQKAQELGLCNGEVSSDKGLEDAVSWLNERVYHSPEVVRAMKDMLCGAVGVGMEESLAHERRVFAPLWGGPAQREAMDTIQAKF